MVQTIVGIPAILIGLLVICCIAMAWEETEFQWRRKLGLSKGTKGDDEERSPLVSGCFRFLGGWWMNIRSRGRLDDQDQV